MAVPSPGDLITKDSLLNAIATELIFSAYIAATYYSGNLPTAGAGNSLSLQGNRLGSREVYMVEFISKANDVVDADIVDSILNTALRCTQVRKATYEIIVDDGLPGEYIVRYPNSLFRLDIQAQQWYEEFNELGRKFLIRFDETIRTDYLFGNEATGGTGSGDLDPDIMDGAIELCRTVLEWHRAYAPSIDLISCHADCHGNCHSNRSRR